MTEVLTARTGVGLGLGALLGLVFGGPWGAGIGALLGGGIAHSTGLEEPKGVMTPKRQLIFTRAMESIKNPDDLLALAAAFAGEGLNGHASLLTKRANLRRLPAEVKARRRDIYRRAMTSDNADAIDEVAMAFANEGAIDAARNLRDHAIAVRAAHAAGKSASPQPIQAISLFADKLAKALIHFGPNSGQVRSAAANLIRAQGKQVNPEIVSATIGAAMQALGIQPQQTAATTPQTEETAQPEEEAPAEDAPVEEAAVVDGAPSGASTAPMGAVEPTVVGPPAAPVEPPAGTVVAAGEAEASAEAEAEAEESPGAAARLRVGA